MFLSSLLSSSDLSMPFINLIFASSIFFATGTSTLVSIHLGKKELKKAINKEEDCVSIIKLQSEDSFDEEILGSQKEGNEDSLII